MSMGNYIYVASVGNTFFFFKTASKNDFGVALELF